MAPGRHVMVGEREGPVRPLDRHLSPLDVWGMAFGCMVGWGVFVMPGSTFLPIAGPAGTLISLLIGMAIMLIIARSITFFMSRTSITGGMYSYIKEAFGRGVAFFRLMVPLPFVFDDSVPQRHGGILRHTHDL